jgi:hypothetical protein
MQASHAAACIVEAGGVGLGVSCEDDGPLDESHVDRNVEDRVRGDDELASWISVGLTTV